MSNRTITRQRVEYYQEITRFLIFVLVTTLVEIKECDSSPCAHGATCNDELNGYECKCVAGFQGRNCETGIMVQLCL